MRILIVDDSRSMRLILRRILGEIGHTDLAEAADGSEALVCMDEFCPQLALVDWNMPVMNGLEFVSAVRERREYDRVKMMMVTSESSPRLVYDALKAGADEFAMKPVTREVIEEKLMLLGLS